MAATFVAATPLNQFWAGQKCGRAGHQGWPKVAWPPLLASPGTKRPARSRPPRLAGPGSKRPAPPLGAPVNLPAINTAIEAGKTRAETAQKRFENFFYVVSDASFKKLRPSRDSFFKVAEAK